MNHRKAHRIATERFALRVRVAQRCNFWELAIIAMLEWLDA